MKNIQEVLDRLTDNRKEKSKIKRSMKDAIDQSKTIYDCKAQIAELKKKIKQAENKILEDFREELAVVDKLTKSIKDDTQLISDIALTQIMKGERVNVTSRDGKEYGAQLKVQFKQVWK